ncbi:tubulin-tyrosine ligase [Collybia nuda]|uniref:Tubulin-tyrosine ligase n=1 Tax=Collybia nuda TaxID=64659 RepID=A0A9P5XW86_9AGAR|nr:tubulin-tyrosine ligase [Collybia nuda]
MIQTSPSTCVVSWPGAPLTNTLVINSLKRLRIPVTITPSAQSHQIVDHQHITIQWSTYDQLDHELTYLHRQKVLSSSYTYRKALIRKHFLSRCILSYVTKHPTSPLKVSSPKTFEVEIVFADDLDEMWSDELWDLGEELDLTGAWWILKPGMADRGMGIRLFNSKVSLQRIFEEFEGTDSEDSDNSDTNSNKGTAIVTSQLRHFVIQEYINNPLLLDPSNIMTDGFQKNKNEELKGHKFHIRAYCVCKGALEVYLYDRALALFSSVPYINLAKTPVKSADFPPMDLAPHLTNTSLQSDNGGMSVWLLEELIGRRIMSAHADKLEFNHDDMINLTNQMVTVLAETFKAALENPIHFQPLPNAFELYGVDFLVAHESSHMMDKNFYQVKLLEINAEPAIELTGPRLTWILEELFESIGKVCVEPFVLKRDSDVDIWKVGDTYHHMIKCYEKGIRQL